jgi:hypothetical protein
LLCSSTLACEDWTICWNSQSSKLTWHLVMGNAVMILHIMHWYAQGHHHQLWLAILTQENDLLIVCCSTWKNSLAFVSFPSFVCFVDFNLPVPSFYFSLSVVCLSFSFVLPVPFIIGFGFDPSLYYFLSVLFDVFLSVLNCLPPGQIVCYFVPVSCLSEILFLLFGIHLVTCFFWLLIW